jgi:hypothetical protein
MNYLLERHFPKWVKFSVREGAAVLRKTIGRIPVYGPLGFGVSII